jgi:hypothetical protein
LTVLFLLRVPDWTADLSLGGPAALLFGNAYLLAYVALLAWLPIDERRAVNAEEPAAEPEPAAEAGAAA